MPVAATAAARTARGDIWKTGRGTKRYLSILFARRIAEAELALDVLEAFNLRAVDRYSRDGELAGKGIGVEANQFKIRQTELHQLLIITEEPLGLLLNDFGFKERHQVPMLRVLTSLTNSTDT